MADEHELSDRLIRVRVLDAKGRSIPNGIVRVFAGADLIATARASNSLAGTVYDVQVNDRSAEIALEAEYEGEVLPRVKLAPGQDKWDFHFTDKVVPMPRDKPFFEEHLPGLLGVFFLLLTVWLAIKFPNPTKFQYRVFAGTLAIGLGGVGAEIPGFINLKLTLGQKLVVTAGGALAVFVIAWFFQPAS